MQNEELVKIITAEELHFYHDFWKQYIELEKLFLETEKYVTIAEDNRKAFSVQYNILLQAICAEIDAVCKRLCFEYNSGEKVVDMGDYIEMFLAHDEALKDVQVDLQLYDMHFKPWANIGFRYDEQGNKKPNCPYWWNGYISLKHKRVVVSKKGNGFEIIERNLMQANQRNVLGALSALYILEMRCLQKMRERFNAEFAKNGFPTMSVGIYDRFNNSMFQETVDIIDAM